MTILAGIAASALVCCDKKPADAAGAAPVKRSASSSAAPESVPTPPPTQVPVVPAPDQAAVDAAVPAKAGDFASEAARILGLADGPERDAALAQFVRGSMHGGFERTDAWIRNLPAGPTRDTAYTAFIEDLTNVAPMLALDYISRIGDPAKRASLEAKVRASPRFVSPPAPQGVKHEE